MSSWPVRQLLLLCMLVVVHASVYAQDRDISRGKLLYSTYCNACHSAQIHWRDKKLVTGWDSLKAQVRRWQESSRLGWNEDDIGDVARYLNDAYYHFSSAGQNGSRAEKGLY